MEDKEIAHPHVKDIELEQVFKALGDPLRLSIVKQLLSAAGEEIACGHFEYSVTKATFSHHLQILRESGVIRTRQDGTRRLTSLRRADLKKRFPGLLEMLNKA